jgi:18S rRNA (guanine1575-N7)-methyltransferase
VLQFYPENKDQLEMISNAAIKCGFSGGIVIDYPNSSLAKKYYLAVSTEHQGKIGIVMLTGKDDEEENLEIRESDDEETREFKKSQMLL